MKRVAVTGRIAYDGNVILDDAKGIVFERVAIVLANGTRKVHPKPVTIDIKRQYILSVTDINA